MCGQLRSPAIPSGLSMCECGATGSASHHLLGYASCSLACPIPYSTTSLSPPAPALSRVLSTWLPISAPPTGLDECFFCISLVVGLPCGSIFCQFWLVFVFKLLLSFFWLCEEAHCVYLCLHLGRKLWYLSFTTWFISLSIMLLFIIRNWSVLYYICYIFYTSLRRQCFVL